MLYIFSFQALWILYLFFWRCSLMQTLMFHMERCLTSNQFTFFWHCPAASLCEWLHTKLTADFASLFILVNFLFFFFWLKILANFGFSPIESQNPWCPGPWIAHQTRVFLQAGRSYLYAFKRDHVWFDLFRLRIPTELKLTGSNSYILSKRIKINIMAREMIYFKR